MRLRFRSITYAVGGTPASLERHYRELRESMLRAGAHYGLQSSLPWRPPIDIHETPDAIVVKMELAGVGEDDINITLYDNALVVTGQRANDIQPDESVYYHEAQVRYGPFRADVLLPLPVNQEAVQATYEHGFLRVRLPKARVPAAQSDDTSGETSGETSSGPHKSPQNEVEHGTGHGTGHGTKHDSRQDSKHDIEHAAEHREGEVEALKAATAARTADARRSPSTAEPAGVKRETPSSRASGRPR